MLDIFKNIPGLNQEALEEEAEERKPNPYPNGPVQRRTISNGQIRRAKARAQFSAFRKHVKRQRRQHWDLRVEGARLDAFLTAAATGERPDAVEWLEKRYETVEKAEQRLRVIYGEPEEA